MARITLMSDPVNRETYAQPPKHCQIPGGVEGADTTLIFQGYDVEPLVEAVFDAPVAALVGEQSCGIVMRRRMRG